MSLEDEEAEVSEQLVVVGVDGSPASFTALRWVLACHRGTDVRLRAVRCWTPVLAPGWEAAVKAQSVPTVAEQEAQATRELAQVVAAALAWIPAGAARIAVQQQVVCSPAGPGLVSQATGADLLVVGHCRRSIEVLHRSVSWYCVRHANCPVLVFPPAMATRRELTPLLAGVPA
jgi:nucleotide-binding universal stress UspA family protein